MNRLQVVMAMAGRGQRFRDAGFAIPKPLVLVDGKPMFLRALDSIEELSFDLHLIIRRDAVIEFNLEARIKDAYPTANVEVLDFDTRGATESVMKVESKLDPEAPLLILDCDLFFESPEFLELVNQGREMPYDGLLLTFTSNDPRYSYVMSTLGIATQVKEKIVISENALIGAYYWKVTSDFIKVAREILLIGITSTEKELYISSTYQKGIERGLIFKVLEGRFASFGTPEELAHYDSNRNNETEDMQFPN